MADVNWPAAFYHEPQPVPYYHDLCGGRLMFIRALANHKLVGFYCPASTCDLWIVNGHLLVNYHIVGGTEGLKQ